MMEVQEKVFIFKRLLGQSELANKSRYFFSDSEIRNILKCLPKENEEIKDLPLKDVTSIKWAKQKSAMYNKQMKLIPSQRIVEATIDNNHWICFS